MTLNEWASKTKRDLFEGLSKGLPPSSGQYDEHVLKEAKSKGMPQMGATVFAPASAKFEFVYKDHLSTIVFSVTVTSPERIVFLPVPSWVIETIWQGDIDGSYHFESDATALVQAFGNQLNPAANALLFGRKQPTRRE